MKIFKIRHIMFINTLFPENNPEETYDQTEEDFYQEMERIGAVYDKNTDMYYTPDEIDGFTIVYAVY